MPWRVPSAEVRWNTDPNPEGTLHAANYRQPFGSPLGATAVGVGRPYAFGTALAGTEAALGLLRPHVAGLSFGSVVALELYRRHPLVPKTLVLASAYAGWARSLPRRRRTTGAGVAKGPPRNNLHISHRLRTPMRASRGPDPSSSGHPHSGSPSSALLLDPPSPSPRRPDRRHAGRLPRSM
jgi:pimeloyl-ACP methyl ester carboxylesterase